VARYPDWQAVAVGRWAHEQLGIPEAEEGEPILTAAAQAAPFGTASAKSSPPAQVDGDEVGKQVDQLESASAGPITAMVEKIRSIVDESESFQDLQSKLIEAWPEMDASKLSDVMAEALAAAQLAGRFDIMEQM